MSSPYPYPFVPRVRTFKILKISGEDSKKFENCLTIYFDVTQMSNRIWRLFQILRPSENSEVELGDRELFGHLKIVPKRQEFLILMK